VWLTASTLPTLSGLAGSAGPTSVASLAGPTGPASAASATGTIGPTVAVRTAPRARRFAPGASRPAPRARRFAPGARPQRSAPGALRPALRARRFAPGASRPAHAPSAPRPAPRTRRFAPGRAHKHGYAPSTASAVSARHRPQGHQQGEGPALSPPETPSGFNGIGGLQPVYASKAARLWVDINESPDHLVIHSIAILGCHEPSWHRQP
jgi:hypothetical protein